MRAPSAPRHVVTGANTGIGLEITRGLAATGAQVVLACRDRAKGEGAIAALRRDLPAAALSLIVVDFASQASIRSAAAELAAALGGAPLDVLVNNAAVVSKTRSETVDGREVTFATNVLGYHLFTALVLPLLEKAPRARVVNVASQMAYGLELDDVEWRRRPYDAGAAYAQSKQANRMLTWALARRLSSRGSRVTATAMHPGPVGTPLLAALAPGMRGRTTARGADTAIWLATSADVEGQTGKFYGDREELSCKFRGEADEDALVLLCDRMTGLAGR